ncbi:MAG: signal peptidase I [Candidatus Moranbacteria bacterium]|nr:signal peptidase I [Candidatus Moranbacteria bacterium]
MSSIGLVIALMSYGYLETDWFDQTVFGCKTSIETKTVRGHSMEPLLRDGTDVRVLVGYYACHTPDRGDIAVLHYVGNDVPIIKRVFAVPGDAFRVISDGDNSKIEINGQIAVNSAGIAYSFSGSQAKMLKLYEESAHGPLPSDAYLVLGDQVEGSLDSTRFGLIGLENFVGKADR